MCIRGLVSLPVYALLDKLIVHVVIADSCDAINRKEIMRNHMIHNILLHFTLSAFGVYFENLMPKENYE